MIIKHLPLTLALLMLLGRFAFAQQQWTPQQSHTGRDLEEIFFANPLTGWAFGETDGGQTGNNIRHTTDQGISWLSQGIGQENAEVNAAWMFDTLSGIAVGRHSPDHNEGLIAHTANGGISWQIDISTFEEELTDIHFPDPLHGWIAGSEGFIAFSSDGGLTWQKQNTPTDRDLYGIYFSDNTNGVAVGDDGTVLHTSNGGQNWQKVSSGTDRDLAAVTFSGANRVWAAGDNGKIIASTDGGLTWASQNSGTSRDLADIDFVNDSTGWAVGDEGTVRHTADGGQTWTAENSGTSRDIRSVYMVADTCGWFCGDHGIIFIYKPVVCTTVAAFGMSVDTLDLTTGNTVSFSDSSQNASSWQWDFGNGNASNQQNPADSFLISGTYLIRLIVSDGICKDTAIQTLEVVDSLGMNLMAPPFYVLIFPNPVSYQAKIDVVTAAPTTGIFTLTLFDMVGNICSTQTFDPQEGFTIEKNGLPTGIYFYVITSSKGQTQTGKVVFQ